MTAQVEGPAVPDRRDRRAAGPAAPARPWWLLPAMFATAVIAALVATGVISVSSVLYAALFGGMILMHTGGHGHGHGGHASAGDGAHGSRTSRSDDLSGGSSGAQDLGSGSGARLGDRAANDPTTRENERHDQHGSHGCH